MDSVLSEKKKLYDTLLSFPPFFTLQEHEQSRAKQVSYWSQIIHNYCRQFAQHYQQLDQRNLQSTSGSGQFNRHWKQSLHVLKERLSKEEIVVIMQELERIGCVEFQIGKEKILISHFSPYEMADDMYRWAKENYLIGDVETLQFIAEGDHTNPKHKFYKQPKEILLKVIDILEKQNKAARIQIGSDISVKFL